MEAIEKELEYAFNILEWELQKEYIKSLVKQAYWQWKSDKLKEIQSNIKNCLSNFKISEFELEPTREEPISYNWK